MNHWKIDVMNAGRAVQAYPTPRDRGDTSFDEVAKRIGMMVLAERIEKITVYRDGEVYRRVDVQPVAKEV